MAEQPEADVYGSAYISTMTGHFMRSETAFFAEARLVAAWLLATPIAILVIFCLVNLAVTVTFLAQQNQMERLSLDAQRLAMPGAPPTSADARRHYELLYSERIGPAPEPAQIRRYLEVDLARGRSVVLDQTLVDYIISRWDAIDSRTVPPGVYVGARAIGPDNPPLSRLTKYLGHYAVYVRHGYILVVPPGGPSMSPTEFSASRVSDFEPESPDPHSLMIHPEPFKPGAYDFPSRGQAIHELRRVSADPAIIRATIPELTALAGPLRETGARYALLRQNSNTVLGCMLRASDLHRQNFASLRRDRLLSLRLLGISSPLWNQPLNKPKSARCQ